MYIHKEAKIKFARGQKQPTNAILFKRQRTLQGRGDANIAIWKSKLKLS